MSCRGRAASMKPYYEDAWVTLYHGDCLELADVWTGADVLVTDPPYGMSYRPRGSYNPKTGRMLPPNADAVANDGSTTARDSALAVWGWKPAMVFGTWRVPRPGDTRHRLIWWKQGQAPGPARAPFLLQDEEIYVLGEGWVASSPPKRSVIATSEPRQGSHGAVAQSGHPTPKPVTLMEWLIERCQPEWTIADPFAGSGATLIAARNLGRKAVGVELEEKYCELIAKRLERTPMALDIFGGAR